MDKQQSLENLESHLFDLGDRVITPMGAIGIVVGVWFESAGMPNYPGTWRYRLEPANRHSPSVADIWWIEATLQSGIKNEAVSS